MSDYEALKAYGFSPAKAAEIELDAKRGDRHALSWLRIANPASAGLGKYEDETGFDPADHPDAGGPAGR